MAHDGEAALAAADAFRPDVMLLDIGLPLLSGYEVCRRLREQPWGGQITVIALTGWGDQDARDEGRGGGLRPPPRQAGRRGRPRRHPGGPGRRRDRRVHSYLMTIDRALPSRSAATPLPRRPDGAGLHSPDDELRRRRRRRRRRPRHPERPDRAARARRRRPGLVGLRPRCPALGRQRHRHPGPQPHRLVDAARPESAIPRQRRRCSPTTARR